MRTLAILVIAGLLFMVPHYYPRVAGAAASFDEVGIELMCQCGCRRVLTACDMPECSIQKKMGEQIRYMIDQGQEKEEIIRYFVNSYGEEVLAAPTKQGFNLTAWITPFAAIAAGLGFVYLVLDQWVWRRGERPREEEVVEEIAPAERDLYEERLKRELEQFEGGA